MTLRITREELEQGTLLHVFGDLSGAEVAELEVTCLEATPPLTLDLKGLTTVDGSGLVVLRTAVADGARLIGASPYVAMRLERRGTK